MIVTIKTGTHSSAQGPKVSQHNDGRITIDTGRSLLTGYPIWRLTPTGI